MDRFDLEDAMSRMQAVEDDIDDIIYKVGDCPERPTEDDILNLLIGVKTLSQARYSKMWSVFEQLIKDNVIASDNVSRTIDDTNHT